MTVRAWLRWPALVALGAVLVLIALQGSLGADETRTTWDFEGADALDGWVRLNATMTLAPGEGAEGSQAAGITLRSPSNIPIRRVLAEIWYPLDVQPGATYEFGGVYVSADGKIDWVRLGMRLYDKHGNPLAADVGPHSSIPGKLHLEAAPNLCSVVEIHFRVLTYGAIDATVYLDNLSLKESAPATPCPTPIPSQTPTATPVPSQTPTSTPSPSQTPTSTPVPSQTPTSTPSASHTPTSTHTPSPSQTPTSTPVPSQTPTSTPTPSHTPAATATASQTASDQPATATNTAPGATATEPPPAPASLEFSNGGFEEGGTANPMPGNTSAGC